MERGGDGDDEPEPIYQNQSQVRVDEDGEPIYQVRDKGDDLATSCA